MNAWQIAGLVIAGWIALDAVVFGAWALAIVIRDHMRPVEPSLGPGRPLPLPDTASARHASHTRGAEE